MPIIPIAPLYTLFVNRACPLCQCAAIARNLKGLDVVKIVWVDAIPSREKEEIRWKSTSEAIPSVPREGVLLPYLWDNSNTRGTGGLDRVLRMLNEGLHPLARHTEINLHPPSLTGRLQEFSIFLHSRLIVPLHMMMCTHEQHVYETAYRHAHAALFRLEQMLSRTRFLFGYKLTEGDCLAFPYLLRYDTVYRHLFKCSLARVEDFPNLCNYVRELYQLSPVQATTDVEATRRLYCEHYKDYDPTGILPLLSMDYGASHNRAEIFPMPCCDKGVGKCKNHGMSRVDTDVAALSEDYVPRIIRTPTLRPGLRLIFRGVGLLTLGLLAVAARKGMTRPGPVPTPA